ncbi:hypothetical protein DFH08DRAFT_808733 [Mycena albidolilacea]|uniref:Chlorophyllase n=1 Tax=Mycena albidolilacea TaxID=1033008 RepID=A0AAD7A1Z2_9AGAR|nr:hypothetical protein DFH08DRAFT_808733 [Mycena albidolilacea]
MYGKGDPSNPLNGRERVPRRRVNPSRTRPVLALARGRRRAGLYPPVPPKYPTVAAALSQIARHFKTVSILPGILPFNKIVGIGHSAGSGLLTFGAIVEGAQSPFDGLILTSAVVLRPEEVSTPSFPNAQDENPLRWGALDPAYITTTNDRAVFYPVDPTTYSPRILAFNAFTKDVASVATAVQFVTSSLAA